MPRPHTPDAIDASYRQGIPVVEIFIGIVLLVTGGLLTFAGLRAFVLLLPILAFLTGFFLGGSIVASLQVQDERFLSNIAEWITGHILGITFAVLSYMYWYAGVMLAAAAVGAMIGMGLMGIMHVDTGWMIWVAAVIGAVILAFVAFIARSPARIIIGTTAAAGAILILTSISLILGHVVLRQIRWGAVWGNINVPWSSWLVFVVLIAAGVLVQWGSASDVLLPGGRWMRGDAAARRAAAAANESDGHR